MSELTKNDLLQVRTLIKTVDEITQKLITSKRVTGHESKLVVALQGAFSDLITAETTLEIILSLEKFRNEEKS